MPILKRSALMPKRGRMPKRERTEASIERSFCACMGDDGFRTRKMNGFGFNDWPDRMVLGAQHFVCFVELKRAGKDATERQALLHDELRALGFSVLCTSDPTAARAWVRERRTAWKAGRK